jgi:hypothetical protein
MKRTLSLAVGVSAVWLWLLSPLFARGTNAVNAPDTFYDPTVAAMVAQVLPTKVYDYDAQLSGEAPIVVSGALYTLTTRHTNSGVPIQKATQFVYEFLQAQGLSVSYHTWSACSTTGRNVIGELPGTVAPDQIVLITAHLDDMPASGAAPGADDNASGSVGVMIAAEILSKFQFERTLRFIFFTGEEQGLCGSNVYANAVYAAGENIVAVYNMDMIAWDSTGGPTLRLHTRAPSNPGYGADLAIAGIFTQTVQAYGLGNSLTPIIDADGISASDHYYFWTKGYPALLAIEDDDNDFNAYYHTSNDRLHNLNLPYFTAFVKASVGTAAHLARVSLPLSALRGTVLDAVKGTPIGGARVAASAGVTRTGQAATDANGQYVLALLEGDYTVTASAYGYAPVTAAGVAVRGGLTATQDFSLTVVPTHTVSGVVRDALTHRPLSATLIISGYPYGAVATDPQTGAYQIALAEAVTYSFHVQANVPGYLPADRPVGALTADRVEHFALQPDLAACTAPGYIFAGVRESFTLPMLTTEWVITGTAAGWSFNNPHGRPNATGGTGSFAIADSDHFGPGVSLDTELRSPLLDLTGVETPTLTFKTDLSIYELGGGNEVADVDVSVDGGGTWQNVWRRTEDLLGPQTVVLAVPPAGDQAQVRLRFHYYDALNDGWWQVDDVHFGACRVPEPTAPHDTYIPLVLTP